jgi:transcriptional regulator with XRE-family HTH domain
MPLGDRIKLRREEKKMTAAQLAREAGISKGYLSDLEASDADKARPSADVLFRIATALGTSVADLLEREVLPTRREVAPSLRAFADARGLPDEDIEMLANIRFRGAQPSDEIGWQFLYESIKRSIRP